MKRFVWRLQRVLDIKEKQEQKAKAELMELTEKLAAARGELLTRQKILEQIISELTSKNPGKRLGEQEFFLKHSAASNDAIKRIRNKITELESQQKAKVVEVLDLRKFKEGLKRLRTEAKAEFIKEQEKLQQKDLDERAGVSFVRKARI
ncbi:hypothetical protein KY329_05615 [Candidatus Woesearchaeota archaeon]|nr:hypothetical protein [Candidatus Woesearchaeota archaeon]